MLFKPEHVAPILEGRKTQTRRVWSRCRVKVGAVHKCYTRPAWVSPPGESFASVKVLEVRQEALGSISEADAHAEGYENVAAYLAAFARINNDKLKHSGFDAELPVYVVTFEVAP